MTPTAIRDHGARPGPRQSHPLDKLYAKINWRILPLPLICYIIAFLDRVNIGYAQLQMKQTLPFSSEVYGLGAGIFFVGYFLFEVPSNLLLQRIGVRKTLLRIMVLWGIAAAAMMFVKTPTMFYVLRFLLGACEAGFFPGIVLYFTYWYPSARRGQAIAILMTGATIAAAIAGPLSGAILKYFDGNAGLHGWQWMFVLQGLPAAILGVVAYFYLPDSPAEAAWLSADEKARLHDELEHGEKIIEGEHAGTVREMFRDPKVYVLAVAYFMLLGATYMLTFWLPTLINGWGVKDFLMVGLIAAVPPVAGTLGMVLVGRHSDKHRERRWHFAATVIVAATGLGIVTLLNGHVGTSVAALALAYVGLKSATPLFFTLVSEYFSVPAAAVGIAVVSSLGNLGPAVTPWLNGWVNARTGGTDSSMYLAMSMYLLSGVLVLVTVQPARVRQHGLVPSAA